MKRGNRTSGEPTKDQFAKLVMAAFHRADRKGLTYDKVKFRIKHNDGTETYLSNLYAEHCRLSENRRESHLRDLVRSLVDTEHNLETTLEEARPHLRPKVYLRAHYLSMQHKQLLKDEEPSYAPFFPVGEHLVSTVVYDQPTSIRTVLKDELTAWNVTFDEAMTLACENLLEAELRYEVIQDGLYATVCDDFYDSSRLLLLNHIEDWPVEGDFVVTVPTRDTLFVTGSRDKAGLETLFELTAQEYRNHPRALSPLPLRLVNGKLKDWAIPKSHKLYSQYLQLQSELMGELYAPQYEYLVELHEKEGIELVVAGVYAIQDKATGLQRTYCTWIEGIDSLLPKTDLIAFYTEDESVTLCEWDRVMDVIGNRLERHDEYYPPLYLVTDFPTARQIQKIGVVEM